MTQPRMLLGPAMKIVGLAALMRFGNPLRQLWGLVSSWRRYKESRSALEMLNDPSRADALTRSLPVAQTLVTTADPADVPLEGTAWRIDDGRVTRRSDA